MPRSFVPFPTRTALAAATLALAAACEGGMSGGAPGDSAAAPGAAPPAATESVPPAVAAAPADESCRAAATVAGDGIGPARLGASVAELARLCAGRDTTFTLGEGITEHGAVVSLGGGTVVALANQDTIRRLIVRDPGLATSGGLRVGSTIADVRRAFPQACALVGEGVIVVAADALSGVSFGTSADFGRFAAGGEPKIAALPDTAQVVALWVHGVERPCGEAG